MGENETGKTTPKFERGKIVFTPENIDIYVSGTAAILGELTIEQHDIESQTVTTIENILELVSMENLKNNISDDLKTRIDSLPDPLPFSNVRAYVKHISDIETVRKICNRYFGDCPMIILKADICRNNLLVEIEGSIFI